MQELVFIVLSPVTPVICFDGLHAQGTRNREIPLKSLNEVMKIMNCGVTEIIVANRVVDLPTRLRPNLIKGLG